MAEHSNETLELFAQIGDRLRIAREERGYTLQELSAHTRIHQNFLQKIEAGELKLLPGMAFVKGFIRNYLQVLEIDDGDLEEQIRRLGTEVHPDAPSNLRPSNPQLLDSGVEHRPRLRLVLFAVAAVLVGWLGYVFFLSGEAPGPTPRQEAAAPAPEGVTPGAQRGVPAGAEAVAPGTQSPAAPSPAAPAPTRSATGTTYPRASGPVDGRQKLELTLRGLEPSWVRLSVDRAPPVDIFIQPAETVAWEANQEFQLVIGKSQGVAIYLNGEEYPLPQEPNRLIPNLVLNKLTLLRLEN